MYSQQRHSMQSIMFFSFRATGSMTCLAKYRGFSSMGQTSTQRPHLMHSEGSEWSVSMAMMPLEPFIMGVSSVVWGSNGIIAIDNDEPEVQECIKCGRCVDVCPMELKPLHYYKLVSAQNWQGCKDMNIMDCMECRCCEYICSSKLPLVTMIKMGKNGVRGLK